MADPFEKMAASIAARLGVSAVLGGVTQNVVIEHGVAITGEAGEVVAYRDIVSIAKASNPKVGDEITVGGETFHLDSKLDSDGYFVRFALLTP